MTPAPLLNATSLCFAYGQRAVLNDVSISVAPGELVALLGPNGSGKSTLIKTLLGLLRARGNVEWDAKPLRRWRRVDLARRVAYLPQAPSHAAGDRVIDVLRLGRAPYWRGFGLESTQDEQVVRQVASDLHLNDLLSRPMSELSGGQRQLVYVGRCLVQEPRGLLLDEPATYLDLRHQVELLQLLKKLSRERSIGVLMASHDLNLTASYADRLLVLHEGRIVAMGNRDAVLRPEILSPVYGLPMKRIDHPGGVMVVPIVTPTSPDSVAYGSAGG